MFIFNVQWLYVVRMSAHHFHTIVLQNVIFRNKNFVSAFSTRLFAVLRFESVIHEFDPYFNYRTTRFLTEQGFYSFHNWFDDRAWYPLGRIIGGTIYPGNAAQCSGGRVMHKKYYFYT